MHNRYYMHLVLSLLALFLVQLTGCSETVKSTPLKIEIHHPPQNPTKNFPKYNPPAQDNGDQVDMSLAPDRSIESQRQKIGEFPNPQLEISKCPEIKPDQKQDGKGNYPTEQVTPPYQLPPKKTISQQQIRAVVLKVFFIYFTIIILLILFCFIIFPNLHHCFFFRCLLNLLAWSIFILTACLNMCFGSGDNLYTRLWSEPLPLKTGFHTGWILTTLIWFPRATIQRFIQKLGGKNSSSENKKIIQLP